MTDSVSHRLYYAWTSLLNRAFPGITLAGRRFHVRPSVCKPIENEYLLAVHASPNQRVLDIGCGSGVISIFAALRGASVTAVDVNPEAVENTICNARAQGVESRIHCLQSDMFGSVSGDFDLIVCHPPYLEQEMADVRHRWATSPDFVEILLRKAPNYLAAGGRLVILWPAGKRDRVERLLQGTPLRLIRASRHRGTPLKLSIIRRFYLQVGFEPTVYEIARRVDERRVSAAPHWGPLLS